MTIKERTTLRLSKNVRKLIEEKCPTVNLSLLMNNTLEYVLTQNEEIIKDFTTKK